MRAPKPPPPKPPKGGKSPDSQNSDAPEGTGKTPKSPPLPSVKWLATTAARLAAADRAAGDSSLNAESCARQALALWQASSVVLKGAYGNFDWWELAFEEGAAFEETAASLSLTPIQIHPGNVGCAWWTMGELAEKLYTGKNARARLFQLIKIHAGEETYFDEWGMPVKWPEHVKPTWKDWEASPEPDSYIFSPWIGRELWKCRRKEISEARSKAGQTRAVLDAVNLEPLFQNNNIPVDRLKPSLRKGPSKKPRPKKKTTRARKGAK